MQIESRPLLLLIGNDLAAAKSALAKGHFRAEQC
jgi:hypothetical protein